MLSTMQEILILLEDEKEVPLYRINRWGRSSRGAISKLKNIGWIEKKIISQEIFYRITPKGEKYFDETLKVLKNKPTWDNKWRLVIFDVPETDRAVRDRLRRSLKSLGLGILQASVWISSKDIKDQIKEISERLKLQNKIRYFEVSQNPNLNRQIIEKSWNLPDLNLDYDKFILSASHALKSLGNGNNDRYKAKKYIFEYALILKKDPALPKEFLSQNKLREEANKIYLELRKFVV